MRAPKPDTVLTMPRRVPCFCGSNLTEASAVGASDCIPPIDRLKTTVHPYNPPTVVTRAHRKTTRDVIATCTTKRLRGPMIGEMKLGARRPTMPTPFRTRIRFRDWVYSNPKALRAYDAR